MIMQREGNWEVTYVVKYLFLDEIDEGNYFNYCAYRDTIASQAKLGMK